MIEQDIQRKVIPKTIKRHHSERADGIPEGERPSSSTSRLQKLRSAAIIPPATKTRIEDVEPQRMNLPTPNKVTVFQSVSGSDRTMLQHEQGWDWSFFGDMIDSTSSYDRPRPSKIVQSTGLFGRDRHSQSVVGPIAGIDRKPDGSTRLRVPYFR